MVQIKDLNISVEIEDKFTAKSVMALIILVLVVFIYQGIESMPHDEQSIESTKLKTAADDNQVR